MAEGPHRARLRVATHISISAHADVFYNSGSDNNAGNLFYRSIILYVMSSIKCERDRNRAKAAAIVHKR